MTLYDLYLDNQVEGYLVFKTLAKQKVIEMTDYQYHKKLKISKEDLQPKGSCLSFPLQNNFEDVIHILESHTGCLLYTSHPLAYMANECTSY